MTIKRPNLLLGYVLLVFVPIGFATAVFLCLILGDISYLGLLLLMVILYVLYLFTGVEYDQKKKKRIVKGLLTPDEQDVILTTTQKGDWINMDILQTLHEGEQMSQMDITRAVNDKEVELTHPMVRQYVLGLEKRGLIKNIDPNNGYEKNYSITSEGLWYLDAFRFLFPNRTLFYLWRHELGRAKLPKHPSESANQN